MGTDTQILLIHVLAAAPPTIAGVAAFIVAMRGGRKVEEVHLKINSRMDQLLAATADAARAEGIFEGRKGLRLP